MRVGWPSPVTVGTSSAPASRADNVPRPAHSLTLSSGAVFATSLAVQLIGFAGTVFLMHVGPGLTATGRNLIGTAQFFLLIGSSINGVGDLRLGSAYAYFLARGKAPTDNTSTYLALRLSMVGTAGLILFVVAPISFGGIGSLAQGPTQLTSLGIFLMLPLLWSISTVYNQMFIGLGNSLRAQFPPLIEALVRLPPLIYVSYYATGDQVVLGITVAYALGAAASALFSISALRPRLRRVRGTEASRLFRYAWPLMGSLMLGYLVTNMIPFLVASLGKNDLTVFLAANGWRVLVLSLPAAVTTPLFPYLAGLHKREEFESLRRGIWQALRYATMLLIPGAVALITYRYNFLNVFANGAYAAQGALTLAILVAGALPLALSQIMQSSINAVGRQRLELYITSTQVAVLFVSVALLMSSWSPFAIHPGIVAAAVAILVSSCAAVALNTFFMERLIRVHIHPRPIVAITASAAGSFGALSFVNHLNAFPVNTYYQLLAAVLIGFLVYFLILAAVGELTRSDVRRIGTSVGLPRRLYEPLTRLCWRESGPDLAPVDLSRAAGLRPTELPETFTGARAFPDLPTGLPPDAEERPPPPPPD